MLSSLRDEVYQVQLAVFEGPLDLLLHLIERDKLDISAVSLAQVTDQFLAHVHALEDVRAGTLADFLEVTVKLVWIKSRLLLPQPRRQEEEDEEDPAEALARQLREYKRFKEAAAALRTIEEAGLHTYGRIAAPPELERRLEADAGSLNDLLAAARAALAASATQPDQVPEGMVVPFTLTIQDQIEYIGRTLRQHSRVTFHGLLSQARHRMEIIVTLLAVLELIKRGQALVMQARAFGEIYIEPVEGAAAAASAPAESEA